MSTDTHRNDKSDDAPPTKYPIDEIDATLSDLESQIQQNRDRIQDLDPTGPNGKLRRLRRSVQANTRAIKNLRHQLQELDRRYEETAEACRNAASVKQDLVALQGKIAELEEGAPHA